MTDYFELERFYLNIIQVARQSGVVCGVTSGMACVAWGVAPTTQDCDILVQPESAQQLLEVLESASFLGYPANFRGSLSPPLDVRWLEGGWTCHFHWAEKAFLDVFGVAPRASHPWQSGLQGFYVSQGTVAEMKKTNRPKDWPFATALALKMLSQGDEEGWLHLGDADLLASLAGQQPIPQHFFKLRPALRLAAEADPRLEAALIAEQLYWQQLDKIRLQCFQSAVRPYAAALRNAKVQELSLLDQQATRCQLASQWLPVNPLAQLGFLAFVEKARAYVGSVVQTSLLDYLPDVLPAYGGLFDSLD